MDEKITYDFNNIFYINDMRKIQERKINEKTYSFISNISKKDEKYLKQAMDDFEKGDFYIDQHAYYKAGGAIRRLKEDVAICCLKDKWIDVAKFWELYRYYRALDNPINISKSILDNLKTFQIGDIVIITEIKNKALEDNNVFVLNKPIYKIENVVKKNHLCTNNKEYCSKTSKTQCISICPIDRPEEIMYICECMIKKIGKQWI